LIFFPQENKGVMNRYRFLSGVMLSGVLLLLIAATPGSAKRPQRIVSLAPNLTEMIFKLGVQDRLVGRTEYDRYPPAVREIPSVGGYLNTDYEKILSLHPDLIVMLPSPEKRKKFQSLGLPVLELPDETVEEILHSLRVLGETLGASNRAQAVVQGIRDTLQMVKRSADSLNEHPIGLLLVGRQMGELRGLYAAGRNSYLGQLWKMAGGQTAFPDINLHYFNVNQEALLTTPIQVILEFHPPGYLSAQRRENILKLWRKLPTIPAVRNQRIFLFDDEMFLIPGPRIARVAVAFFQIIHSIGIRANDSGQ